MSFYGATDTRFGLLVTSLDFKARVGSLIALGAGVPDVCSLTFTSGETPADLLISSIVDRC